MKLKELLDVLTKYYEVIIHNPGCTEVYEDQTVVPESEMLRDVETLDFYEDSGEGESLLVGLAEPKPQIDERQMTWDEVADGEK